MKAGYVKLSRRSADESIRLDVERIEKGQFDSMLVFSALNDFALSVCVQSLVNENPKIKRKDLVKQLRDIIVQNR